VIVVSLSGSCGGSAVGTIKSTAAWQADPGRVGAPDGLVGFLKTRARSEDVR
jgi:hypothetical protein